MEHEPSTVARLANWYCDTLQETAERAQSELFDPASEHMSVYGDELDQLVFCHRHLLSLRALLDAHVECLGVMIGDTVAAFGGTVVTDSGVVITVRADGQFEAVEFNEERFDL